MFELVQSEKNRLWLKNWLLVSHKKKYERDCFTINGTKSFAKSMYAHLSKQNFQVKTTTPN